LNENEKKKIKIREKGTLVSYLPMKEKNLKLGNYLDLKQVN
jgi:hypothetical protein